MTQIQRVWCEVGCEWSTPSAPLTDDSEPRLLFELPNLVVTIGRFNGGRHVYAETKGTQEAADAFEEAFGICQHIYDLQWLDDECRKYIPQCTAENLPYLRRRLEEYEAECEAADAEYRAAERKRNSRWEESEWHDFDKLVRAARDAGWSEKETDEPREARFYHIAGERDGRKLILRLDISTHKQEDRWNHGLIWLHDGVEERYANGGGGHFNGWNQLPGRAYIHDIDFIDRWLCIPTPAQALASFKQVISFRGANGDSFMRQAEYYSL